MENNKEEIIDAYLQGRLSQKENQVFEQQLAKDQALREELEFRKNLQIAVTIRERKRLKAILSAKTKQKSDEDIYRWKLAAAVSGLIFIVAATIFFFNKDSNDKLFLAYYETFPNIEVPTVRGSLDLHGLTDAFLAYDNEEYELAQLLFKDHFQVNEDFVSGFYGAMASIEIGDFNTALELLINAGESPDAYEVPRLWYMALLNIKLEKQSDAMELLNAIAQMEHPLAANAVTLKMRLD